MSAITLAAKNRIAADTFGRLLSTLQDPKGPFVEMPVGRISGAELQTIW